MDCCSGRERLPRIPLLGPRPGVRHGAERPLGHRLGAVDGFERQDGDLEIWREQERARVSPNLRATVARSGTSPLSMALWR